MARPWREVSQSDQFKELSSAEQEAARKQYFAKVVAPRVPEGDLEAARRQFDQQTRAVKPSSPPPSAPATSGLERAGTAIKESVLGLVDAVKRSNGPELSDAPVAAARGAAREGLSEVVRSMVEPGKAGLIGPLAPMARLSASLPGRRNEGSILEQPAPGDQRAKETDDWTPAPLSATQARQMKRALLEMSQEDRELAASLPGWRGAASKELLRQIAREEPQRDVAAAVGSRAPDGAVPATQAERDARGAERIEQAGAGERFRDRTTREVEGDFGAALVEGVVNVPLLVANMADASSPWAGRLNKVAEEVRASYTPQRQQQKQELRELLDASDSEREKFGIQLASFVAHPTSAVEEVIRQAPIIAAMVGTAGAGGAAGSLGFRGAAAGSNKLLVADAISGGAMAAAARTGGALAGGAAAGATMAGGGAAGQVYERLMDPAQTDDKLLLQNEDVVALLQEGKTLAQAREIVATTKARLASVLAAPLGALAGRTGLERVVAGGFTGSGKRAAAAELTTEVADELGTQAASNFATGQVDPNVNVTDDFGPVAATAVVASGPFAGLTGYMARQPAGKVLVPTQARAESVRRFDELAAAFGLSEKAAAKVREQAGRMPAGDVPGFLARATDALNRRGLFRKPVDERGVDELSVAMGDVDPAAEGAGPAPAEASAVVEPQQAAPDSAPAVEPAAAVEPKLDTKLEVQANEAATSPKNDLPEPSQAQKDAGNYKVGRARIAGLDISIENPAGSVRRGVAPDGTAWETPMVGHYGYIRRTTAADGDKLDVFVAPGTAEDYSGPVFVVDQVDPQTGRFDEHKALLGYESIEEAEAGYRANYTPDWQGLGAITALPMPAFKAWAMSKATTKPLGDLNERRVADVAGAAGLAAGARDGAVPDAGRGVGDFRPVAADAAVASGPFAGLTGYMARQPAGKVLVPTQARAESVRRFDELAAAFGLSEKAAAKVREQAGRMPAGDVPGFLARATDALNRRGLFRKPVDERGVDELSVAIGDVDPAAEGAGPAPAAPAAQAVSNIEQILDVPSSAVPQGELATAAEDYSGLAEAAPAAVPASSAEMAGEPINRAWSAFTPDAGSLNLPREQLPQIKAEHRGALVNFLAARGVAHEQTEMPASELRPSQGEFSPKKVEQAKSYEGGDRSILVSSDGYVLDGHHQWLAKLDDGVPVKVIRLDAPIQDLLRLAHQFPSSTTARGATRSAAPQAIERGSEPRSAATGQQPPYAGDPGSLPGQDAPIAQGESTAGSVDAADSKGLSYDETSPEDRAAFDKHYGIEPGRRQEVATKLPTYRDMLSQPDPAAATPAAAPVEPELDTPRTIAAGDVVTLDGKPWTVAKASPRTITIRNEAGKARTIAAGSPSWTNLHEQNQAEGPAQAASVEEPDPAAATEVATAARSAAAAGQDGLFAPARSGAGISNALAGFSRFGSGPVEMDLAERQAEALTGARFPVRMVDDIEGGAPAMFDRTDNVVLVNRSKPATQAGMVELLVEEFLHGVDSLSTSRALSTASQRLMPAGDIFVEAESHFTGRGEFSDFLHYPLSGGYSPARTRAELFARLGVVYLSDPARMKAALPTAHEAYHAILGDSAAIPHRGVPRTVRAQRGQDGDGPQVGGQGGDGQGSRARVAGGAGQGRTDPRLEQLRALVVGRFQSRAGGGFYSGGLNARPAEGPATASAQAHVDAIVARWNRKPKVHVIGSMDDAPEPVRRENEAQLQRGATGEPVAFVFGGEGYILAGQIRSIEGLTESLFHEALGHMGLRGVFGDGLNKVLDQMAVGMPEVVRAKALQYGLAVTDEDGRFVRYHSEAAKRLAAEEVLAELAQTRPSSTWVQRALAVIKQWLRENVPGFADLKLTDAEVISRFIVPARRYMEDGGSEPARNLSLREMSPAFERSDMKNQAALEKVPDSEAQVAMRSSPTQATPTLISHGLGAGDGGIVIFQRSGDSRVNQAPAVPGGSHRTLAHYRGMALQVLGRRQLVELYESELPQLRDYSDLVQQMDAEQNDAGAQADTLARRWAKLKDENALARLMHDATLAGIDPAADDAKGELRNRFKALSKEARGIYIEARDAYRDHFMQVEAALADRIRRTDISSERRQRLLAHLADNFKELTEGVYFPLARFGDYMVIVRNAQGEAISVSRAETLNETDTLRRALVQQFKSEPGATVSKVLKDREFSAKSEGVSTGFLGELYEALEKEGVSADLMDDIGQLYLSSLPDLSWAKHGLHRKKTPGFSQDARRAFASYMFHGARYLGRVRYADRLLSELEAMQKHVDAKASDDAYDSVRGQQVVDEMVKRHDLLMNPRSHPISTALTSVGFVFHLGLSPASAMVNLAQTPLVAYPLAGAQWGYAPASMEMTRALAEITTHGGTLAKALQGDEAGAYRRATRIGLIDVTLAHDLAGVAAGEDAKVHAKLRPVMRAAAWMFHHAERVNREVTFIAAYRLERKTGASAEAAFNAAVEFTYRSHFDYGSSNRPRIMQGNWQRVILLFKQFAQNMVYLLSRQAQQSLKGATPEARAEARKALAGLLVMHASAAGVLGLPLVSTLLAAASMIGSDEDEPWDAETALRNMLADAFGQKPAEVLARGLSRLTPWDISGRVGLDRLILPDVYEGLEGQRAVESWFASALGPVVGIAVNVGKGVQSIGSGDWVRGLEEMMPSALRGPMRAYRFATEGANDRSGLPILDEVDTPALLGQVLGLSPSALRNAQEGRSAVIAADRALTERRSKLINAYARAEMGENDAALDRADAAIDRWNDKQPDRPIKTRDLNRSVAARQRRIDLAEDGPYLPRSREDAREAGRFARTGGEESEEAEAVDDGQ